MAAETGSPPHTPKNKIAHEASDGDQTSEDDNENHKTSEVTIGAAHQKVEPAVSQSADQVLSITAPLVKDEAGRIPGVTSEPTVFETAHLSNEAEAEGPYNDENAHQLPPFDWQDFEIRYAEAMSGAKNHEAALSEEFHNLAAYFDVWAQASAQHDDERSSKRLRTRAFYVQNSEQTLEQKRNKYLSIVNAFSQAFSLFDSDDDA